MQAIGIERLVDQQRARHHLRHDDEVEIHMQAEGLVVVREHRSISERRNIIDEVLTQTQWTSRLV